MQETGSVAAETAHLPDKGNRRLWAMFVLPVVGKPSKELSKNPLACQNSASLAKCELIFPMFTRIFPLSSYFSLLFSVPREMADSRRDGTCNATLILFG